MDIFRKNPGRRCEAVKMLKLHTRPPAIFQWHVKNYYFLLYTNKQQVRKLRIFSASLVPSQLVHPVRDNLGIIREN